ncbi:hypothetical protein CWI38_0057p0090 [Hamiltosporidium tvaerminnensis]|uniref:Uncharacterized protein n=1 Tax=Hamiltosporidium tvaerminnensis TaxID=1176355 RepID=A0A4Q9M1H7_9MICR|nr:hypothetical protein CWI38_0057p0090 [Hamiltosporidium tvaerminnensis]
MDGKELIIILVRVVLESLAYYNAKIMYTCSSIQHISPILTMYLTHSSGCLIILKDMVKYRLKYFEKMEKDTGVGRRTFMVRVVVLSIFYNLCHIPKFYSMKCLRDAYIVSIYGSSVLFSHVFSLIFNIEKISRKGVFSMVLCLAGLVVIVLDDVSCRKHYVWAIICFLAAVFSGLYTVLLKICIEIPEKVKKIKNNNLRQKEIDFYETSNNELQKELEIGNDYEIKEKMENTGTKDFAPNSHENKECNLEIGNKKDLRTRDFIVNSKKNKDINLESGKNIKDLRMKTCIISSLDNSEKNLEKTNNGCDVTEEHFLISNDILESSVEQNKKDLKMTEVKYMISSEANPEIKKNIKHGISKDSKIDFKTNLENNSYKFKPISLEIQDFLPIESNITNELHCLNEKVNENHIDTKLHISNQIYIPPEIPLNTNIVTNKSNKENKIVKPNSNIINIEKENLNRKLIYMKYYMGLTGLFTLLFYWPFLLLVNLKSIDEISIPTQGRQIFHIFAANILSLCQNTIYLLLISYKSPVFAQVSGIFFQPTVVIIQLFRSIDIIHCTEILGCFSIFFSFCLLGKSKKS